MKQLLFLFLIMPFIGEAQKDTSCKINRQWVNKYSELSITNYSNTDFGIMIHWNDSSIVVYGDTINAIRQLFIFHQKYFDRLSAAEKLLGLYSQHTKLPATKENIEAIKRYNELK